MINQIIDGISVAINSEFGDSYEIYTESVEQGLKEPCFSVLCLNPAIGHVLGKRYFRTNLFCIHYFPESDEPMSECNSVAERLIDALEIITVTGDLCRGTDMHYEVHDDVMSFFVSYNMHIYKNMTSEQVMESVVHKTDMKG